RAAMTATTAKPLWPHQERGVTAVAEAIDRGARRILLSSPTGMGKSRMVCDLIDRVAGLGWHAVLYTNRRLLVEQLVRTLAEHGIDCGVRAAGWGGEGRHWPVQVSSLPTEQSRVVKREIWALHGEGRRCLAVIDEAHLNNGRTAREIVR